MKNLKEAFTDVTLRVLFVSSVAAVGIGGYQSIKETNDIVHHAEDLSRQHNGRGPMDVIVQHNQHPETPWTEEERQILKEADQLQEEWSHEKKMHGLAILGLVGVFATGAAIGFRSLATANNFDDSQDNKKPAARHYTSDF